MHVPIADCVRLTAKLVDPDKLSRVCVIAPAELALTNLEPPPEETLEAQPSLSNCARWIHNHHNGIRLESRRLNVCTTLYDPY